MSGDPPLDRGVAIVAALAHAEPSIADVVDALESVFDSPDQIRTVLDKAEADGLIEREGSQLRRGRAATPTDRRGRIIKRDGEFSCRRCGRRVTTGQFVRIGDSELGPYGSTCIRRITGRE